MSEMLLVTNTIHVLMVLDPNVATEPDSSDDFGGITHTTFHVNSLDNKLSLQFYHLHVEKNGIEFNLRKFCIRHFNLGQLQKSVLCRNYLSRHH